MILSAMPGGLRVGDRALSDGRPWGLELRPGDDANPMIGHHHPTGDVAAGHVAFDATRER